jgi:tetratricopeptide (TPR) repeat protein
VSNPIDTTNPEANEHYLRGLQALDTYTRTGTEEAINQFNAALSLDQRFAAAYLALGRTHYVEAEFSFVPPETGFVQVRENAEKALQFQPHSAVAHALLARVATLNTWDWQQAQRETDAALALGPEDPFTLFSAGDLAFILGKYDQSERLYRAALVSDPLSPETYFQLGGVLDATGQIREAEAAVRRGLAISPSFAGGHFELALLLGKQGKQEAVAECQLEPPEGDQFPCLAEVYDQLGHRTEADAALETAMQDHGDGEAFWIAAALAYRQQDTLAFEWLDRAWQKKEPFVAFIKSEDEFDHLHSDSRYKAFLQKLHLPE